MTRSRSSAVTGRLDFGEMPHAGFRRGLRLATPAAGRLHGPDKYRVLDVRRRRAQIKARRVLGLV